MDPLVNYTTWWLDDGCTSVVDTFRSTFVLFASFVLFLT
jgi:hypothetical protein